MTKSRLRFLAPLLIFAGAACRLPVELVEEPASPAGRLLITELGPGSPESASSWLEVYNAGAEAAELSRYALRTCWLPRSGGGEALRESLTLPPLSLPPGAYALLRGAPSGSSSYVQGRVAYLCLPGGLVPDWSRPGAGDLELLRDGESADFLRFGDSAALPTGAWAGGSAPDPTADPGLAFLARDGANTDRDEAGDWRLRARASPGGPNDLQSEEDLDEDGIPDLSESPGGSFAGLDLSAWGAGPDRPDVFIQVDYMAGADPGLLPRREALEKVRAAFLRRGIRLHFDLGSLFHPEPGASPEDFDLDDRSHEVAFAPRVTMGARAGFANLYDYKDASMELPRRQVFHYLLFGSSQRVDGREGPSGLAELCGNDLLLSLGGWGLGTGNEEDLRILVNFQAATLMHELGHNFGLRHGGFEDANYKPNYRSAMNYLYQLAGLPRPGEEEGDRYYYEYAPREYREGRYWSHRGLADGPSTEEFRLDYSEGLASPLLEAAVDEAGGLGLAFSGAAPGASGPPSAWVDFDLDALTDEGPYARDLNPHERRSGAAVLEDWDDWSALAIAFRPGPTPDFIGPSARASRILADPAFQDRQELVEEPEIRIPR